MLNIVQYMYMLAFNKHNFSLLSPTFFPHDFNGFLIMTALALLSTLVSCCFAHCVVVIEGSFLKRFPLSWTI